MAASLGVRYCADGIVATGTPMGTPEFVAALVQAKAENNLQGRRGNAVWCHVAKCARVITAQPPLTVGCKSPAWHIRPVL